MTSTTDLLTAQETLELTTDETRTAVLETLVCVVVTKRPNGTTTRRPFFSLEAADRAVKRARLRGHGARVVLVRLQPVAIGGGR